jgi:hypothetical protein
VRYRQATVLELDPLTVAVGNGGEVPVAIQDGAVVEVGDAVDCLETDGVLLVLGRSVLTAPEWAPFPFAANWSGSMEYRKVGDRVELRGGGARMSGSSNLVGTLTPESRPPADLTMPALLFGAAGYIEVTTAGQIRFYDFTTTTQTIGVADGIAFSTTA